MGKYTRQDYIRAVICSLEMPAIVLAVAVLAEFIGWLLVTTFPRFFLGTTSLPESSLGMFLLVVLSPDSAAKILAVIHQPGPIVMESEELGDYRPILDALAAKGKDARILLPASISAQDHRNAQALARAGVDVRLLPVKPVYLHGKVICGRDSAFAGSENVSYSSIMRNREMGLIVQGEPVAQIERQFATDWSHSEPLSAWRPKRNKAGW